MLSLSRIHVVSCLKYHDMYQLSMPLLFLTVLWNVARRRRPIVFNFDTGIKYFYCYKPAPHVKCFCVPNPVCPRPPCAPQDDRLSLAPR